MWDKGRQRSHCLYTCLLLVALLGEFPESELKTAENVRLLKVCVSLNEILLQIAKDCGIVALTKAQIKGADACTVTVFNAAIDKSIEREFMIGRKNRLDLYAWLLSWQCGLWAFADCVSQCSEYSRKNVLVWKVLKRSLEDIESYIERYEKEYPDLQDDSWILYESNFIEFTKDKRFNKIK